MKDLKHFWIIVLLCAIPIIWNLTWRIRVHETEIKKQLSYLLDFLDGLINL
jgi:hypothetical protein